MNLALNCELIEQNDKIVKSVFVAGLIPQHDDIRMQLLMKERKLDKAVLFAPTMHASQLQSKSMEEPAENQLVNKVERGRSSNFRGRGRRGRGSATRELATSSNFSGNHNPKHGHQSSFGKQKSCKSCGNSIHYKKCPAIGRNCSVCGKPYHLKRVCNKRSVRLVEKQFSSDEDDYQSTDDDGPNLFIGAVNGVQDEQ
ncbi:uncharacterized protein [Bemisia tabaci]|uniref:uncharacterized protein n=1 Tax=Bemisia tabaci TaxID=7038 RepID=UPI003B280E08